MLLTLYNSLNTHNKALCNSLYNLYISLHNSIYFYNSLYRGLYNFLLCNSDAISFLI